MSLKGALLEEREILGGAWTGVDIADIPPTSALLAQNLEFLQTGLFKTRFGFQPAYNAQETFFGVSKMANWQSSLGNKLVWGANDGTNVYIRILDIATGAVVSLNLGPTGPYYNFIVGAGAGARLYVTSFSIGGSNLTRLVPSINPVSVISYQAGNYVIDTAFAPPMAYAGGAITEPGAGFVTAGTHLLAYRVEDRSGFLGIFSPNTGGANPTINTFAPVSFTAAGNKNLQWILNPPAGGWPATGVKVQLLMTTVDDTNRWYAVPGSAYVLPVGGGVLSVTATANFSDDELIAGAATAEVTADLNLSISIGNASIVRNIGDRMFYLVDDVDGNGNAFSKLYISDIGAYQNVTKGQHFTQLPGQQDITNFWQLRNTIFINGPHSTHSTVDNGGVPVEWQKPTLVDGTHGAFGPYAVEIGAGGMFAFTADETGIYIFDGAYFAPLPLSAYQAEWNATSWILAIEQGQVVDDPVNHNIYVLLPVGPFLSATNHLYSWNYAAGLDPKIVKFSEHTITNATFSSIIRVRNDARAGKPIEIWGALNGTQKPILRLADKNDTNPYWDYSAFSTTQPVHWVKETSLFPKGGSVGQILKHWALALRAKGVGILTPVVYSYDKGSNVTMAPPITLSLAPDDLPIAYGDLNSPGFIYRMEQNTLGNYAVISMETCYYSVFAGHR